MMNPKEYLVTSDEMQRYDSNTIHNFNIPGIVLMEQAALACYEEVINISPEKTVGISIYGEMV